MQKSDQEKPRVLITGGTSGLGFQLVKIFIDMGWYVVTTGRREKVHPDHSGRVRYYKADFSHLETSAATFREICDAYDFDIVINNAGILSPPRKAMTENGLEYTFQVNFLSHLLLNEIILKKKREQHRIAIVSITSPVYKFARIETRDDKLYSPLQAYSDSKLYLALMCKHLMDEYPDRNMLCFSFDPGVFGSGIYRMQSRFFGILYRIAAPFMRKPDKVAAALAGIITGDNMASGLIYNTHGQARQLPDAEKDKSETFWKFCHDQLRPYL